MVSMALGQCHGLAVFVLKQSLRPTSISMLSAWLPPFVAVGGLDPSFSSSFVSLHEGAGEDERGALHRRLKEL